MNESGFKDLLNDSTINADSLIVGILLLPNLDSNSIPIIDSSNNLSDIVLNNGEIIVGKTGNAPIKNTLTGTTDQVNITNGPGTITLSLPQSISTTSSPSFNGISLTSINTVPVSNYIITPSTKDINMNNYNIFNVTSLNGKLVSNYLKTPSSVDLDMNNHYISNFNSLRPYNTNLNIGNTTSLSLNGVGQIVIGDFTTSTGSNAVCIGLQNIARSSSVAIGKETIAGTSATVVGYRSSSGSQTDSCVYGHDNVSSGTSADIFGINRTNSQANTLLLGSGSYTHIRSNVGCSLATALLPFNNIYSDSQLIGTVNSRLVNDILCNTATGTLNNLCSFVLDKIIKDSTIPASK